MERIVVTDLLYYLSRHKLIGKQQHGFIARRSTTTNLLESLNDWSLSIKNGKGQKVAYIDFAKAFDSVSQQTDCQVEVVWYLWIFIGVD